MPGVLGDSMSPTPTYTSMFQLVSQSQHIYVYFISSSLWRMYTMFDFLGSVPDSVVTDEHDWLGHDIFSDRGSVGSHFVYRFTVNDSDCLMEAILISSFPTDMSPS